MTTTSIDTLIQDIYKTIKDKKSNWFDEQLATAFATDVSKRLQASLSPRTEKPRLRLSAMGQKCPRALWYSIHWPELAQALPATAEIKYTYGHIIEAMTIMLAKASGHEVTGEQDELDVDGVLGHRDCVIDGNIVDVKSSASPSFLKFEDGSIAYSDSFGYLDQLDGYVVGSRLDPLVRNKSSGYILAVDKTLGKMCLYEHRIREDSIRDRIVSYKQIIQRDSPPPCTCGTLPDGESGNVKLDLRASYSPYKFCCFPNLRTFVYSKGPVYLTKVGKIPTFKGVPLLELDKYGKAVYN